MKSSRSKKLPRGFFITGTDTGVGKTVVTAALAMLFRRDHIDIGVMKPIETGCGRRQKRSLGPDARFLCKAACSKDHPDLVAPYLFSKPLAPMVAAEAEGGSIDLKLICERFHTLASRHEIILVEGVGGVLAPLTRQESNLDLVRRLSLPTILVVGNRLGAINHTLLSLNCLERYGMEVSGIVMNQVTRSSDDSIRTNLGAIRTLTLIPVLGTLPFISSLSVKRGRLGQLRAVLNRLDKGFNHLRIKLDS